MSSSQGQFSTFQSPWLSTLCRGNSSSFQLMPSSKKNTELQKLPSSTVYELILILPSIRSHVHGFITCMINIFPRSPPAHSILEDSARNLAC